MSNFQEDFLTKKPWIIPARYPISEYSRIISSDVSDDIIEKGKMFAQEISDNFISDFEKSEKLYQEGKVNEQDFMVHVSTFIVIDGMIYMSYYANTKEPSENPDNQTARLAYCPVDDLDNKTILDIQTAGDMCGEKKVSKVYDTILMKKDDDTIYVMWTAQMNGN